MFFVFRLVFVHIEREIIIEVKVKGDVITLIKSKIKKLKVLGGGGGGGFL
jgi:hypothetical protein